MKNVSLFTLFFFLLSAFTMQAQNTLRLNADQRLGKGQKIEVAGKGYLILQDDGNLVAYDAANRARWATGTNGIPVTQVMMHSEGYLALHDPTFVWISHVGTDRPSVRPVDAYFEINLTTWAAFIFTPDNRISKELLTGTLLISIDDISLGDQIAARSKWFFPVMQADGTLGLSATIQDSTICKVVTNRLLIKEDKKGLAYSKEEQDRLKKTEQVWANNTVTSSEEDEYYRDLLTGALVSSPGEGPTNIKVTGLEEFRELYRDREVTFFCQAGYVSRFELSYDLNGENKSFSSNYLPVGQLQSFKVPWNATNIVAKGFMISAGEHPIFNEKLSAPADVCYKTYGTIFDRRWTNCN